MQEKQKTAPRGLTLDEAVYVAMFGDVRKWRRHRFSFPFITALEIALGGCTLQHEDADASGIDTDDVKITALDRDSLTALLEAAEKLAREIIEAAVEHDRTREGRPRAMLSGTPDDPSTVRLDPHWVGIRFKLRWRRFTGLLNEKSVPAALEPFVPILLRVPRPEKGKYDDVVLLLAWAVVAFLETKAPGWQSLSHTERKQQAPLWFNRRTPNVSALVQTTMERMDDPESVQLSKSLMHEHFTHALAAIDNGWQSLSALTDNRARRFCCTTIQFLDCVVRARVGASSVKVEPIEPNHYDPRLTILQRITPPLADLSLDEASRALQVASDNYYD